MNRSLIALHNSRTIISVNMVALCLIAQFNAKVSFDSADLFFFGFTAGIASNGLHERFQAVAYPSALSRL